MSGRITRAAAAREAAALLALSGQEVTSTPQQLSSPPATPVLQGSGRKQQATPTTTTKRKKETVTKNSVSVKRTTRSKKPSKLSEEVTLPVTPVSTSKGRKRKRAPVEEPDINELPHNLGKLTAVKKDGTIGATSAQVNVEVSIATDPTLKVESSDSPKKETAEVEKSMESTETTGANETTTIKKTKRVKMTNPYGLTPGISPFPDWQRPTPEECEEVNKLLSELHGEVKAPASIPAPSLTVTGCGEVPSVLDALMRTLLSGATTGANSAMAFQGLVNKFGILDDGEGKGSVDWNKVRLAPIEDVYQAMRSGGLAESKSKYIKKILDMVYEENLAMRKAELSSGSKAEGETPLQGEMETPDGKPIPLTLNYLHALSKNDAMLEFVKYPGIGVKTAACVILFCLQRPCFAVDTHVFRLSKWLGWLPPAEEPELESELDGQKKKKKAVKRRINEITAFSHLEVRIPEHLKYALHQLFIRHGKVCPRCRAITGETSEDWDKGCVIDHLVNRTGKRKGKNGGESSATPPKGLKKGKGKKKVAEEDDETESGSEYEE
ncbi:hypothetical protein FQN54_008694 [Arachnomyces sp. PD_36]|nr:hypothetical protein FQN54_008694 [Arachnomyces sp. PD_36]